MPIKWTPENDQTLLLKILETSSVQADVKAISKAWPAEKCDAKGLPPTPRAISERLIKIRTLAKANGAGHFSVTSAQSKTGGATSKLSTPRKPRSKKEASDGAIDTTEKSSNHSGVVSPSSSQFSDEGPLTPPATNSCKRKRDNVKVETGENEGLSNLVDEIEIETPTKKHKSKSLQETYNADSYGDDFFRDVYSCSGNNAC